MEKVNLAEKLSLFSDHWSPKIVGEVNDSYVELAKLQGELVWHHHEHEDELFLVLDIAKDIARDIARDII
jgi:mannose-6-phosphate isomerase-like protein (cupin superfamily)